MAENKEVVFGVGVDGVEKSISSLKDLKSAIKSAKDEQVKASEAYGEGSAEYIKASKAVANLKDKMEDLNDSTQSLKGSGVEGLTSSFGLLGDGLKSFDLDKIKTGFKGVGSAMGAIPIFLLISGITLLAEKFGVIEIVVDALVSTFYALTDAMGITNHAQEELTKATIQGLQDQQKAVEERYNSEIKLAKASGQETSEIELEKAKSVESSVFNQIQSLKILAQQKGQLNDDEKKQYQELQIELTKASGDRVALEISNEKKKNDELKKIGLDFNNAVQASEKNLANAKLSDRQREIQAIKDRQSTELEALDKAGKIAVANEASYKLLKDSEKNINELAQIEINKINAKYYKQDAENRSKINEAQAVSDKQKRIDLLEQEKFDNLESEKLGAIDTQNAKDEGAREAYLLNQSLNNAEFDAIQKQKADKEKADNEKLQQEKFDKTLGITKQGLQATQALTDVFFAYRLSKVKGDEKAELEVRKKQFQVNKAFGIVNATIDGVGAVQKALNNPYPLNIILAAISGIAAAANIAKIASTKFDGGNASASSGNASVPNAPTIPSAPVISTNENNLNRSTTFDSQGNNTNIQTVSQPVVKVQANIGVDEVTAKQEQVQVIEKSRRF